MIYLFEILLLIVFTIIYDKDSKVLNRKIPFIIAYLSLTLISAFKFRVGTDIIAYMNSYSEVRPIWDVDVDYVFNTYRRQFGWQIFTSFCKAATDSFLLPQICVSFFVNYSVFKFIKKFSGKPFLCILLYSILLFPQLNFEILRQSVSLAFFLLAIPFLLKRDWKYYYLFAFFAFSFHSSAIIVLIVPLLLLVNEKKVTLVTCSFLALLLLTFLSYLVKLFPQLFSTIVLFDEQLNYTNQIDVESSTIRYGTNLLAFFIKCIFVIGCKDKKWFVPFAITGLTIDVMDLAFPILYRFSSYFTLFYIISVIETIYNGYVKKRIMLICFTVFTLYFTYRTYTADWDGIPVYNRFYPYSSWFEQEQYLPRENRCN